MNMRAFCLSEMHRISDRRTALRFSATIMPKFWLTPKPFKAAGLWLVIDRECTAFLTGGRF